MVPPQSVKQPTKELTSEEIVTHFRGTFASDTPIEK